MNKKLRANLMLLLTAFIWGSAFVAQKSGMDFVGPFTFNGVRLLIASLCLIPVIILLDKRAEALADSQEIQQSDEEKAASRKILFAGGVFCGLALFCASSLQQIGIVYTDAGKAGFITALYIVLVPILGIFLKQKVRLIVWGCVLFSAIGLYLLCMPAGGSFGSVNKGDIIIFFCAIVFAIHILIVGYYSPKVDGVRMSCIQFAVSGILCVICMFIFEEPQISAIIDCAVPILYAGVLSGGIGYTLQIIAQKDTSPTIASLLMSLESVFAVICGMLILHESMAMREALGCIIMFAAIIVAQLPEKNKEVSL